MSRWAYILFGFLVLIVVTRLNIAHLEGSDSRGWGSGHAGGNGSSGGGGSGHK